MKTWEELRDNDIRMRLDEPEEGFWTNNELLFMANDGLRDLATRGLFWRDEKSYTAVADQADYDLPEDFVKGYRLEYRQSDTYVVALENYQYSPFDDVRGVMRTSGFPTAWTTWGMPGHGAKFYLDRAPNETRADGLRLYYYRLPREMVADSDPVDIPAGWERVLSLYVEWNARRKEAKDQRWREAQALYEAAFEEMRRVATLHSDQPSYFSDGGVGYASQIFGEG